jgi:choline dehydrogenase-like flavoprotein
MGADEATAVVDQRLRYYGMDNLYVVDGSVLPTGLGVNPQETIFGIARWAGQQIAGTLG